MWASSNLQELFYAPILSSRNGVSTGGGGEDRECRLHSRLLLDIVCVTSSYILGYNHEVSDGTHSHLVIRTDNMYYIYSLAH